MDDTAWHDARVFWRNDIPEGAPVVVQLTRGDPWTGSIQGHGDIVHQLAGDEETALILEVAGQQARFFVTALGSPDQGYDWKRTIRGNDPWPFD